MVSATADPSAATPFAAGSETVEQLAITRGNLTLSVDQPVTEEAPPDALSTISVTARKPNGDSLGAIRIRLPEERSAFDLIERFEELDADPDGQTPEALQTWLESAAARGGAAIDGDFGTSAAEVAAAYRRRTEEAGPAPAPLKPPTIRVADYAAGRLSAAADAAAERPKDGVRWIDIEAPDAASLEQLRARFDLHPLAVADCLKFDQETRAEDFGNHLLIATHLVLPGANGSPTPTLHEVHFLVGKDFVLTVHDAPIDVFESLRERLTRRPSTQIGEGSAWLFYHLAQELNDRNYAALERSSADIDKLLSALRRGPLPDETLRTTVPEVGGALSIFHKLATAAQRIPRRLEEFFGEESIRSVERRLESEYSRELEETTYLQKRLAMVESTQNALAQNAFNEHQRKLNILAGVLLPISAAAGIFGMNFDGRFADPVVWGLLGAAVVGGLALVVPLLWRSRRTRPQTEREKS